ncbi:hypothetical protein SAMN06298216_4402 [Spirosomataceae bacterium TFI 002]|nr:hypothetical protein SAMN06298216_4402 [Spirosomataceae bacterium TFI 002]
MRFIKEIPNNYCQTSLYSFNNKYIIKFEAGLMEQAFKVSELDVTGQEEVEEMINEEFLKKVIERFKGMQADFEEALFGY